MITSVWKYSKVLCQKSGLLSHTLSLNLSYSQFTHHLSIHQFIHPSRIQFIIPSTIVGYSSSVYPPQQDSLHQSIHQSRIQCISSSSYQDTVHQSILIVGYSSSVYPPKQDTVHQSIHHCRIQFISPSTKVGYSASVHPHTRIQYISPSSQ